jgi:hypothetical protein
LIVVLELTEIGVANLVEAVVGVEPSVVKKMDAPAVVSLRVTDCVVVYVPAAGENVGVAAGGVIVYAAVATALCEKPVASAMALTVVLELTVIGAVYFVDDVVGVAPLVV